MENLRLYILLVSLSLSFGAEAGYQVKIHTLRTEQLIDPMGIDVLSPRLSWQLSTSEKNVLQTAYHILVASSPGNLERGEGDLWDSGKVTSDQSVLVKYNGKELKSNERCYWKVKSYTTAGETPWSEPAFWSMGLLSENNWKGRWIGKDKSYEWDREDQWSRLSARYLRKEFSTEKEIRQATVHIAGLGLYELYINGEKVGNQVLAPVPSDFRKTIYYNSFDVTSLLKEKNAIGVTLGNGRYYTMQQRFKQHKIVNFGYPVLRLNLIIEYRDGSRETLVTDEKWKITADGPIRSNNEYDGEEYDANKELSGWSLPGYDESGWEFAERSVLPTGTLRAQMTPNMQVVDTVRPLSVTQVGEKYIMDMGQNMVGWIKMRVRGNPNDTLRLRFAELLREEGELYLDNLRNARVTDTYIVRGDETGEWWAPRFVYHGFRYVEISGYGDPSVEDFIGEVVSDEMEVTGSFLTSNKMLNAIYKNAYWGILGNYKGMPVDCPQRDERQPWLGDRAMGSWGESYIFNNGTLYAKWMEDIREAQREDGCIPDVAPVFWNYFSDNVTWPAVFLIASDMIYTQYGNIKPIERNYPAMKHWLNHLKKDFMTEGYLVTTDRYGDWCVPPESPELVRSQDPGRKTEGPLLATAYYYKMLQLMIRFAELQGYVEDAVEFRELAGKVKEGFNHRFLTVKKETSLVPGHLLYPDSIYYGNNTVTANILPLAFDMVPEMYRAEVEKNVIATILTTHNGQVSTGVIGIQWLMKALTAMGRTDIAFLLATNKNYPGWGYMVEQGATTIWELWNGDTADPSMNSANHVMLLGDLIAWCYQDLAGIRSCSDRTGYKHIVLKPDFSLQELSKVDASYLTPYGKVVSKWKKTPVHLDWEVVIPANTTAEVHLPGGSVEQIGSGSYRYQVPIATRDESILTDEFLYEEASFPECHGSTIVELSDGSLVAAFFGGTKESDPDCCIWVCRKPKGGKTWTEPVMAADGVFAPDSRKACWNPVLYQIPGGNLLLFYKIGINVPDWSGWVVRSKDGGLTWSERVQLPDELLGPVKNRPEWIDGKIISPSSTEGKGGWRVHFEISEDMGATWRKVGPLDGEQVVLTPNQQPLPGEEPPTSMVMAIQPSILHHADGSLQILCRARHGVIATSWSRDRGESWSPLSSTTLPNNNSGTDAITLQDGRHLIVFNDFRTLPGQRRGPRTPLSIALSEDGVTWYRAAVLEDSPVKEYSYPSVIQGEDGMIHIVYTWRRQRIKYVKIDPLKLQMREVINCQ